MTPLDNDDERVPRSRFDRLARYTPTIAITILAVTTYLDSMSC
ncbi:hypothetical protein [Nocardia sp. A7]